MRPTALIPAVCCIAALILSFLCLFAGHKQSFMEDYHLMTVCLLTPFTHAALN
jgi:hypothetical protein